MDYTIAVASDAAVRQCPACGVGAPAASFLPRCAACANCGSSFVVGSNTAAYPVTYFQEMGTPNLLARLAAPAVRFLLVTLPMRRIRRILVGRQAPCVLDYGCGRGRLVGALRGAGIDAVGFEPSPAAIGLAAASGIPVSGTVPETPRGYDLIMFWHSLEHADAPADALSAATRYLAPDGVLLVAVPNVTSWEARIFRGRWFHYDYPYHRIHFAPQGLSLLLRRNGFHIRSIEFWSPEYAFVGLCQSFLNFFLPMNVLYGVASHRRVALSPHRARFLAALSLSLLVIAAPALLAVFVAAAIMRRSGAMIAIAARI